MQDTLLGSDAGGDVVLVDPVMTGHAFKEACRRRGLPTISLYTLDEELLSSFDRDYRGGDHHVIHAADAIQAIAKVPGLIRAVVPTTEPSVEVGDELGELLGVPSNPRATASARRCKAAMRRLAFERGLRIPAFELVGLDDVGIAAARIGFPAIVKPQRGAGSHGIQILPDADSVPDLPSQDLFGGANSEWLVERYVGGRELAVNAFSQDGKHRVLDMWEYRQPTGADYDQPYWDLVQLRLEDPDWATAENFVMEVLDAFQVRLGPSHTEIKIDASGPCLIEVASRLPGSHTTDHWERHSAIRPYDDTLAAYLGEETGLLTRDLGFDAALAICCLRNDDRPGILAELAGLDEVLRLPGVDAVYPCVAPGDFVPLTRDHESLTAFVLVHGQDTAEVDALLRTVRNSVRLELK
ncbi:ATP-grasp domain-containing protein [Nocardia sp. XZ_19_385]|uniref:ATP-grasp domain-containing protein n=1 Tax=Nocardia sp. XZ_19_385 TaxID=2769488 RepID=UPI00188E54E2|nr:ATP-grasp domain-containing protein [Nocardia sp. XZ_19_385]